MGARQYGVILSYLTYHTPHMLCPEGYGSIPIGRSIPRNGYRPGGERSDISITCLYPIRPICITGDTRYPKWQGCVAYDVPARRIPISEIKSPTMMGVGLEAAG